MARREPKLPRPKFKLRHLTHHPEHGASYLVVILVVLFLSIFYVNVFSSMAAAEPTDMFEGILTSKDNANPIDPQGLVYLAKSDVTKLYYTLQAQQKLGTHAAILDHMEIYRVESESFENIATIDFENQEYVQGELAMPEHFFCSKQMCQDVSYELLIHVNQSEEEQIYKIELNQLNGFYFESLDFLPNSYPTEQEYLLVESSVVSSQVQFSGLCECEMQVLCSNGIRDPNEDGIDCGGACKACLNDEQKDAVRWWFWALLGMGIFGVFLLIVEAKAYNFFTGLTALEKSNGEVPKTSVFPRDQAALAYMKQQLAKGVTKVDIIKNMVKAGWDQKLVKDLFNDYFELLLSDDDKVQLSKFITYYKRKGMKLEAIREHLIDAGWDANVLKRLLGE